MGLLAACAPQFMCGPTFVASLAILRSVSNAQNSYGEVLLSFISVGSIKIDLQPLAGGVSRNVHGQVVRVNFLGIVSGNADVREFDRAVVSSNVIEVIDVLNFGDHKELSLRWVR